MIKMVEETQSLEFFLYDSRCGRERETSKFFLYLEKKSIFLIFLNHYFRDLFSRLMTWHNLDHLLKIKGRDL